MSPTAEAAVCLQAKVIDNNNSGVDGGRRSRGLSDNEGGVVRRQGIYDASKGLETTTEAAGDQRRVRGIYDNDVVVGGGR